MVVRLGLWLGVLLIVFASVMLAVLVVIPVLPFGENNPTLMRIKGALLCDANQRYEMEGQNFSDMRGSGRRFRVYCVTEDGTKIDVSEKEFIVAALAFTVPLILGLFMTITGISVTSRRRVRRTIQDLQDFQISPDGSMNIGGMQIRIHKGAVDQSMVSGGGQQAPDLTDKLHQLEEARSKGLITQDEYEKMRQRILDEMV